MLIGQLLLPLVSLALDGAVAPGSTSAARPRGLLLDSALDGAGALASALAMGSRFLLCGAAPPFLRFLLCGAAPPFLTGRASAVGGFGLFWL